MGFSWATQLIIMSALLCWCVRQLTAHRQEIGAGPRLVRASASEPVTVVAVTALVIVAELLGQPHVVGLSPGPAPLLGWGLLTAAVVVLVRRSSRTADALLTFGGAGLALGVMSLVYLRDGGWPGAAGWELVQPPIVLSVPTALLLLAAPLLGLALRGTAAVPVPRQPVPPEQTV